MPHSKASLRLLTVSVHPRFCALEVVEMVKTSARMMRIALNAKRNTRSDSLKFSVVKVFNSRVPQDSAQPLSRVRRI